MKFLLKKIGKKWQQRSMSLLLVFTILFAAFGPSLSVLTNEQKSYTQIAYAADRDTTSMKQRLGDFSAAIVGFAVPVLMVCAKAVGVLMSNDMIYGKDYDTDKPDAGKAIGETLNAVWIAMRNIANYLFVIVLLGIAFMTVISAGGKDMGLDFDVKSIFPKLVVAIVAVNLTWFGCKVVLDTANVATHVVFGIPYSFASGEKLNIVDKLEKRFKICKERIDDVAQNETWARNNELCMQTPLAIYFNREASSSEEPPCATGTLVRYGKYDVCWRKKVDDWKTFIRSNSIVELFLYGFLNVEMLPIAASDATRAADIAIHSIAALVMTIIVFLALLVMVLALLERVIMLWINIVLSPFGVLMWITQGMGLDLGGGNENLGLKPFMKYAFLPAMMAAPLVLGFIMVAAGKILEQTGENPTILEEGADGAREIVEGMGNLLPHMQTFQQVLWFLLTVAVMWMSVNIASEMTKYAKTAIDGIKSTAEGVAGFALKSPLYAQWIPVATDVTGDGVVDGKDKISIGTLLRGPEQLRYAMDNREAKRASDFWKGPDNSLSSHDQDVIRRAKAAGVDDEEIKAGLRAMANGTPLTGDFARFMQDSNNKFENADSLKKLGRKVGLRADLINKLEGDKVRPYVRSTASTGAAATGVSIGGQTINITTNLNGGGTDTGAATAILGQLSDTQKAALKGISDETQRNSKIQDLVRHSMSKFDDATRGSVREDDIENKIREQLGL
jgi:hypothetical protein